MPGKKGGGNGNPGGGGGGGDGPLYLSGNKKANTLTGGDFADWINGKDGDDTLYGGLGNDELLGADGDDILHGEGDNDELYGGSGDDELYGGDGNDLMQGGAGQDYFDGGDGYDIAAFVEIARGAAIPNTYQFVGLTFTTTTSGVAPDISSTYTVHNPDTGETETVVNVEEIWGSNYNDTMTGADGNDYFVGARGNDVITGNAGDDTLYGSLDDDTIYAGEDGGTGSDTLVFLRYADRYFDENGGLLFEYVFGDGVDTVYEFDPLADRIHFLSDIVEADGTQVPDFDAELLLMQVGNDTVIEYAPGSQIVLVDVMETEIDASHFTYDFVDV